jgi:hypothetical protein
MSYNPATLELRENKISEGVKYQTRPVWILDTFGIHGLCSLVLEMFLLFLPCFLAAGTIYQPLYKLKEHNKITNTK